MSQNISSLMEKKLFHLKTTSAACNSHSELNNISADKEKKIFNDVTPEHIVPITGPGPAQYKTSDRHFSTVHLSNNSDGID